MPCKVCGGYGHNKATCPQLDPGAKRTTSYSVGSYYHRRQNFTVRVAQPSSTLAMATAMQASTLTTSKLQNATVNIGIHLPESSSVVTPEDEEAMRRDEDRKARHLEELENLRRNEEESRMLQEKHKFEEQQRRKQEAILEVNRKEAERIRAKRSRSQEWAETYLQSEAQRCAVYYLDWNDTIRPLKINKHTQIYCENDNDVPREITESSTTNVDNFVDDFEWSEIRSKVDKIQCRRDTIKEKLRFLIEELDKANMKRRRLLMLAISSRIEQYQNEAKIVENEMRVWGAKQLSYLKQCWSRQASV